MRYVAYILIILAFMLGAAFLFHAFAVELNVPPIPVPNEVATLVPWGEWLTNILLALSSAFVWVLGMLVRRYLKDSISDNTIEKAVNFAIATVAEATHGKTMDLKTTNVVISTAAKFAVTNEPKIVGWIGDNLRPLIAAKISKMGMLPTDAHDGNLALTSKA